MKCDVFPTGITAGLSLNELISLPKYPAGSWSLTVLLRGPASVDVPTTPQGNEFLISCAPGVTASWMPGDYWYFLRVTNGVEVVDAMKGRVTVSPDPANIVSGTEMRTKNEIALDAIDAVIANRATMDQQRYRINNRELWRETVADLLKLRSYYATLVLNERRKACGKSIWGGVIRVGLK